MATDRQMNIIVKLIDETKASVNNIENNLNKLDKTATNTGNGGFGNLTASIFKSQLALKALDFAVSMVQKGFDAMGNALVKGADFERMSVATDVLAKNLGYTKDQTEAWTKTLNNVNTYGSNATKTIQSMMQSGLVPMIENIKLASGETGFGGFIKVVKNFGAAFGKSSDDAIESFNKFIVSGRGELVEQYGLTKNLQIVYKEYAETIGKTANDLSDNEKAQARLNYVLADGAKYAGVYDKTYTTAGKNLLSMKDLADSLTETLGSYLQPAFQLVTGKIVELLKAGLQWVQTNKPAIEGFAMSVKDAIQGVMNVGAKLITFFSSLGGAIASDDLDVISNVFKNLLGDDLYGKMKPFVDFIINGLMEMKAQAEGFASTFQPFLEEIGGIINNDLMPALKELWDSIMSIFGAQNEAWGEDRIKMMREVGKVLGTVIGGGLKLIVEGVIWVVKALTWLADRFAEAIAWGKQFSIDLGNSVKAIMQWFSDAGKWIQTKWDEISQGAEGVVNSIRAWFESIPGYLQGVWNNIVSSVTGFFAGIGMAFLQFVGWVKQGLDDMIKVNGMGITDFLAMKFNELVMWVSNGITSFITWITAGFTSLSAGATSTVDSINQTLQGWATAIGEWVNAYIVTPFNNAWTGVVNFATGAFDTMKNALSSFFSGLGSWITNNIVTPFSKAWTSVQASFSSTFETIKKTISDFFSGVNTTVGNIGTIIKGFINSLINGLNKLLDFSFDVLGNKIEINLPDIPPLATGTNYIPSEGIYHLHEGEAVVPKKYNPDANGGSMGSSITLNFNAPIVGIENLQQNIIDAVKRAQATDNRLGNYNLNI